MITFVRGGPFRCALVVSRDDTVDDELLAELAGRTGLTFAQVGTGGFGGGPVADVYADESGGNLSSATGTRSGPSRRCASKSRRTSRARLGRWCR